MGMRFVMLWLILIAIIIGIGFIFAQHIDQKRWQRYQFERDIFFRTHPYLLDTNQQFAILFAIGKSSQKRLINELMLKPSDQSIYKKIYLQRESTKNHDLQTVKVTLNDLKLGYLEKQYAHALCQSLKHTDFLIGRPIELLAEIFVFECDHGELGCRVKLDLPRDPQMVRELLIEKVESEHTTI